MLANFFHAKSESDSTTATLPRFSRRDASLGWQETYAPLGSNKIYRLVKRRRWSVFVGGYEQERPERYAESSVSHFNISTINPHPGPFTTYDGINNTAAVRRISRSSSFLLGLVRHLRARPCARPIEIISGTAACAGDILARDT